MQLPLMRGSSESTAAVTKLAKRNVGDEPAALVHLQQGLFAVVPFGHAHLAAQHAGIDADVGDGLGEARRRARACDLRRAAEAQRGSCSVRLLGRAALMDRREGQESGEARRRGSAIDPCQLEGRKRQREILGPGDEAAFFRLHEDRG